MWKKFNLYAVLAGLELLSPNFRNVAAQGVAALCKPDMVHFSRQDYKAYHQNWNLAQDIKTGFMYVANSKGLLEFDGTNWAVYELPGKQKIRSVATDSSGHIYTGALGEFGYWQPDSTGSLHYYSLKQLIADKAFADEEVWNIVILKEGILFQSFAYMYLFDPVKRVIKKYNPPGNILFVYQANHRLFLEVIGKGLYELAGSSFSFIRSSAFLEKESVNGILSYSPQEWLIATGKGVYLFDGQHFKPFNDRTNQFFRQNKLNRITKISENLFAFGTILNGIIITDRNGNIIQHLNREGGLQNNTVLSLTTDKEGNLWAGLDDGIDLIMMSSPVKYFKDYTGKLGTVYDAALYHNKLYIGTNHGLFFRELGNEYGSFELIPKTQGQVWDLEVIDDNLLCGHNDGTFRIEEKQATLISNITGGWVIKKLKHHPDLLIQGTYTNLCIYQKDKSGKWILSHTVTGFAAPVHQLEEDISGNIWVNSSSKGLIRLKLSPDTRKTEKIWNYQTADLASPGKLLCMANDTITITANQNILSYNASQDNFLPHSQFASRLQKESVRKLFPIADTLCFALKNNEELGILYKQQTFKTIPVNKFQWVNGYENLIRIDKEHFLICTENGFSLLPLQFVYTAVSQTSAKPVIRSLHLPDFPALHYIFQPDNHIPIYNFSYDQNSIVIGFSNPQFSRHVKFSYWLENSSKNWSDYQDISQKEFNNLSPGRYIFHLRSESSPLETTLVFEINPPWYWNTWSKIVYGIILLALIAFAYSLHLKRVSHHQEMLHKKMQRKLKKQQEKSRQQIMQLHTKQLEQDVISKSKELADSTMNLIKKNELLMELKNEVLTMRKELMKSQPLPQSYSKIMKLIENNISSDHDWQLFESSFNKVHESFLNKLMTVFPDLTPSELKLAAYLRMNLSTKEIAQLLNITYRSVELKRYRLRKKLNLDTEVNLGEFMIKYS